MYNTGFLFSITCSSHKTCGRCSFHSNFEHWLWRQIKFKNNNCELVKRAFLSSIHRLFTTTHWEKSPSNYKVQVGKCFRCNMTHILLSPMDSMKIKVALTVMTKIWKTRFNPKEPFLNQKQQSWMFYCTAFSGIHIFFNKTPNKMKKKKKTKIKKPQRKLNQKRTKRKTFLLYANVRTLEH